MGFFRSISDAMNEDFVIGERNVARFNADPDSLDDILTEQHARGIGSRRGLRDYSSALAALDAGRLLAYRPSADTARERVVLLEPGECGGGGGFTAGVTRVVVAAALGLAGAVALNHLQSGGGRRGNE